MFKSRFFTARYWTARFFGTEAVIVAGPYVIKKCGGYSAGARLSVGYATGAVKSQGYAAGARLSQGF